MKLSLCVTALLLCCLLLLAGCTNADSPAQGQFVESEPPEAPPSSSEDAVVSSESSASSSAPREEESSSSTAPEVPEAAVLQTEATQATPVSASSRFIPNQAELMEIAQNNTTDMTYIPFPGDLSAIREELTAVLSQLETTPAQAIPSDAKILSSLLLIRSDYEKIVYTLYDGGITIQMDSGGEATGGDMFYEITAEQQAALLELFQRPTSMGYVQIPQWLYWMKSSRIQGASMRGADGNLYTASDSSQLLSISNRLRSCAVLPGSYQKLDSLPTIPIDASTTFILAFDSGVSYSLTLYDTFLYVESSDKNYICAYTMFSQDALDVLVTQLAEGSFGYTCTEEPEFVEEPGPPTEEPPLTGKPVIYLYPEKTQEISVKLAFNGTVDYTYPDYNNGWRVKATPDGTLTNLEDDSTHYYLFWEGTPNHIDWDFSEGFVVKGEDAQTFLQDILPQMGLTPKEYNDFIVYWGPMLRQNKYNLITFATKQYEELATLDVDPKPDTVLKVHMVYKAIDTPVSIRPQTFAPVERNGFTLVEWGGTAIGGRTQ